jgi:hypothetical protein
MGAMLSRVSTLPALVSPPRVRAADHHVDATPAVRVRGPAPRRERGRPTKLSPELQHRLVATVRKVGFLSTAVRVCGVPPSLVCEWVARGFGRDPDRPPTRRFAEFADAVTQARAQFELAMLEGINRAALGSPKHWRAGARMLERAFPLRYGHPRFVEAARMKAIRAVESLLGAAVDVVERSVRPECRETEVGHLIAVADEIVRGMQGHPGTR